MGLLFVREEKLIEKFHVLLAVFYFIFFITKLFFFFNLF